VRRKSASPFTHWRIQPAGHHGEDALGDLFRMDIQQFLSGIVTFLVVSPRSSLF
jgi:hypothetical protein